jgi:hypothetical protein
MIQMKEETIYEICYVMLDLWVLWEISISVIGVVLTKQKRRFIDGI